MTSVQNPNTGRRLFLISNGPQILGVGEFSDLTDALTSATVHLAEGERYGDLQARPASSAECIAWFLGQALWIAKSHPSRTSSRADATAWLDLKNALLPFLRLYEECDPRTLEGTSTFPTSSAPEPEVNAP